MEIGSRQALHAHESKTNQSLWRATAVMWANLEVPNTIPRISQLSMAFTPKFVEQSSGNGLQDFLTICAMLFRTTNRITITPSCVLSGDTCDRIRMQGLGGIEDSLAGASIQFPSKPGPEPVTKLLPSPARSRPSPVQPPAKSPPSCPSFGGNTSCLTMRPVPSSVERIQINFTKPMQGARSVQLQAILGSDNAGHMSRRLQRLLRRLGPLRNTPGEADGTNAGMFEVWAAQLCSVFTIGFELAISRAVPGASTWYLAFLVVLGLSSGAAMGFIQTEKQVDKINPRELEIIA
ncbi:hypothetical protein BDV93DRAFT_515420 [Ceratobasidium sp. AG-I]|nr:hypothetical protein BDV93DRAFT_515420 [Ceratobasidium sp. AG-I]